MHKKLGSGRVVTADVVMYDDRKARRLVIGTLPLLFRKQLTFLPFVGPGVGTVLTKIAECIPATFSGLPARVSNGLFVMCEQVTDI